MTIAANVLQAIGNTPLVELYSRRVYRRQHGYFTRVDLCCKRLPPTHRDLRRVQPGEARSYARAWR
jgi:hypothetical protein